MDIIIYSATVIALIMLKIDNFEKEYILDLNDKPYNNHSLKVTSEVAPNMRLPWGVELVSNPLVKATPGTNNTLDIFVDMEKLMADAFIVLRNYNRERIKIIIKPNFIIISPREYTFKITRKTTDGKKARVKLLSKENDREIGWECTYQGKPLNYSIEPLKSDKSGHIEIELLDDATSDFQTVIEFTQKRSGKVIELKLNQNSDGVQILKN